MLLKSITSPTLLHTVGRVLFVNLPFLLLWALPEHRKSLTLETPKMVLGDLHGSHSLKFSDSDQSNPFTGGAPVLN